MNFVISVLVSKPKVGKLSCFYKYPLDQKCRIASQSFPKF